MFGKSGSELAFDLLLMGGWVLYAAAFLRRLMSGGGGLVELGQVMAVTIFAALFHDVADRIAPINHARVGAEILRPYIGEETHWVLAHHSIFQGYYYWHHTGKDRNERERYRGHPHFEACAAFCEHWDQRSFDPAYDTMPLEAFLPAVRQVFAREPYSRWREASAAMKAGEP